MLSNQSKQQLLLTYRFHKNIYQTKALSLVPLYSCRACKQVSEQNDLEIETDGCNGCNERAMLPRNDKQEIWTDLHCWRNWEGETGL